MSRLALQVSWTESLEGKGCCSPRRKTVGGTGLEDEDGLRNECTFLQAQDVYSIADRYYQ